MSALPPDRRVAAYVAEHAVLEPGAPLLALVSGGADSLCLWGVLRDLGYEVEALHVDHGLRGAEGEADAGFCRELGATVVRADVGQGGNIEARAREARYALAREAAAGRTIATGHTLSDQAETVLYRLASSSGPRAAAGMRPRVGDLARPLLCLTAEETRAWCAQRGIEPRIDTSNGDLALRRNLIRHEVLPALARVHPGAERNLARTAQLLGEVDELLRELAAEHLHEPLELGRLDGLPRALRAIVLREAAERTAGRPLRLSQDLTRRLLELSERRGGVERLSLTADLEAVRDRSTLGFGPPARYPQPR
jgi:tRNA(Ile)-lysidine synthase